MIEFVIGSRTDVGRVRPGNEDALFVGERLFAVADGMGGHAGGEVAAGMVVAALEGGVEEWSTDAIVERVVEANREIVARADADEALRGMGTTLTLLARLEPTERFTDERVAIANVGDSRAYVFDGERLQQLTDDHTLVQRLVRSGALTPEQAEDHPQRNVLTRALGIAPDVLVDTWELRVFVGDRFLLCSDGLHGELDDGQIAAVLRRLADPQEVADELVRLANEAGGHDNVSVVVLDVAEGEVRPEDGTGEHDRIVVETPGEQRPGAEPEAEVLAADPEGAGAVPVRIDLAAIEAEMAAAAPDRSGDDGDLVRPRRFTWRVALFLLAVLLVAGAALGAVGWSARNTFYVGFDQGEMVIFRGRPGGVLWFDPTLEERTGVAETDVPLRLVPEIEDGKSFGSLDDAEVFVANVLDEIGGVTDPAPDVASGSSSTSVAP